MTKDPLFLLAAMAVLGVAVILVLGVSGIGKGGVDGAKRSNTLMRYRIYAQALAVVLILAFFFFHQQGN